MNGARAPEGGPGRAWFASGAGSPGTLASATPDAPGLLAQGVVEHSCDLARLDTGGWWAVVVTFEGRVDLWRFADVRLAPRPAPTAGWRAVPAERWTTSMDERAYRAGVQEIRRRIREGEVYQVNLCRVLEAPVDPGADPWALAGLLAAGNPAPYAGVVDVQDRPGQEPTCVVCASPELFLRRHGVVVESSPIKGTGVSESDLLPKDDAENVMIVDLVRNDLQHVCLPGTVEVTSLLRRERHPGLVHLVSTVRGRLRPDVGWPALLEATAPPGSVSGAPKSSALRTIADLESAPRGPYCGAVGWVDSDRRRACLAVGIRSFWWQGATLRFGTGAGITWDSDPAREWEETRLKAHRLVGLASGQL